MDKNRINISKIETYLNSIIDNVVSNNTYFGHLPDASVVKASTWNDICLIEIPNGIRDFDAYGQGTVLVWLYARPLESGKKNVAKMSELENKLNSVIKSASDKYYHISRRRMYTVYDTDIDWHCNVVEIILKVF
jgi:hypothetical protein